MKLTPWYPPHIKPIRNGVYITKVKILGCEIKCFQYWSGTYWKLMSGTIDNAYKSKQFMSSQQNVYWKGIER